MNIPVLIPGDLDQALQFLDMEDCRIFAGGTDLMVQKKRWGGLPTLFDQKMMLIGHLPELGHIDIAKNIVSIGAAVCFETIVNTSGLPDCLVTGAGEVASVGIRNMATIGGNICNASPAADILPALYNLDAMIVLCSINGERRVPIQDFVLGPGKVDLRNNELLTMIHFPLQKFSHEIFRKVGTRKANALAKLSFCGIANIHSNRITDVRISFGAVAPTIIRKKNIEQALIDKSRFEIEHDLQNIKAKYSQLINPIDDQRSTKKYRKKITLNLLEDFLKNTIWDQ